MLPLSGEYLMKKKKKKDPSYRPSFQAKPIFTKIDFTHFYFPFFFFLVSFHTKLSISGLP